MYYIVCQLHRLVSPDYKELRESERNATTGCADLKRALAERLTTHYAPACERCQELLSLPHEINKILGDDAQRLIPLVSETITEVRERVGVRIPAPYCWLAKP